MEKLLKNVEELERHRLRDEENVISESWSYQHAAWELLQLPFAVNLHLPCCRWLNSEHRG
jgi:hypothetical protein